MRDKFIVPEKCTGCAACSIICPQAAIDIKMNQDGFFTARVSENCSNCGKCKIVCSALSSNRVVNCLGAYSVVSKTNEVLETCTSGGVCFEIADQLIKNGFGACGVKYNYITNVAEHFISWTINEYSPSKGSKYIQSYCKNAFQLLLDGKKYVVFGTPCQIYGINKIAQLKGLEENFYFIDFFCHGVPSYHLFNAELKYIKKKMRSDRIHKIEFRSKINGWKTYTMRVHTNKGIYQSSRDLFHKIFLSDGCLNKACYNCRFKGQSSYADLRVGDFWGTKQKNVDKGISVVLVFSEKGQRLINSLSDKCIIKEENVSEILPYQNNNYCKTQNKKLIDYIAHSCNIEKAYYKYVIIQIMFNKAKRFKNKILKIFNKQSIALNLNSEGN
ncbi:MAG: Coenzyme F420 hydrogenase/dehydrogenase, beta subunit C-terminal domain [Clostridia bacterium]|nr:Coenzyme F420 hydrogenase/dehydrogenase, beta subunit C-terminal domain [Clostridia bacterium]